MRPTTTLSYVEAGEVATITLQRRRINMAMVRELTAVADHLEDASPCKVVVITAAPGAFLDGVDLAEFKPDQAMDIHGFNKWEKVCSRFERLPKATIAALDGPAIGGGMQLALVCDQRIATPGAVLQLNEVHQGFLPGMATFRLAKFVGLGVAKRLILTAPAIGAEEACRLGLLDAVVPDLQAGIAQAVAAFGPAHGVAIELARRLLNESYAATFEDAIGNFLAAQHRALSQPAFHETLKAAAKSRG